MTAGLGTCCICEKKSFSISDLSYMQMLWIDINSKQFSAMDWKCRQTMLHKYLHSLAVTACFWSSMPALADVPLTVEDLITDKGKFKLDLSIAYANADRQGISTGGDIIVQTGPASFVTLPTVVGERIGNSDIAVTTVGLRYGVTSKAEIYARASYLASSQRSSDMSGVSSSRENRFADAWSGVNYRFKDDDESPALLGFFEVALREKNFSASNSFRSAMLGLTTYKAIDPAVLSLTVGYRFGRGFRKGDVDYRPGNLLMLSPSVGFAVNERITLTTGLQWTGRLAGKVDGEKQGITRTSTDLLLGLGYGFSKGNTLNATLKANASGYNGTEIRVNWLYAF